ncbi:MAG: ABC transporter permease subunit [Armatimonadetes bacterium]|nr:ABC transporter permease subunit [Armatimonadota bacterium]
MSIIMSIARNTVGEAIRRRILLVILLVGILFLVIAPSLNMLTARQEQTVLISLTLGVIQLTSAVIALVLTVYMLPNEVERRTIYTILAKPVQRWQFLVGKYLGAIGALGLMIALMTFTLLFVYAVMQSQVKPTLAITLFLADLVALVALGDRLKDTVKGQVVLAALAAGLMAFLYWIGQQTGMLEQFADFAKATSMFYVQMCLLAAVGVFFSTFVPPTVNFFLSGGVYMIGSLFNSLFDAVAANADMPVLAKMAVQIIQSIIPNFQNFSVQNAVVNPNQMIRGEVFHYINLTGYGLVYISILLIVGILIFDRREV